MRTLLAALVIAATAVACLEGAQGGDKGEKKEVTIKGSVCCAKCALGKETTCMTVVVEKKGDKESTYYFAKDSHKKFHSDICGEAKDGTVVGVVTEKDGKKTIDVKEVKYGK
jgi:hypothetical protein